MTTTMTRCALGKRNLPAGLRRLALRSLNRSIHRRKPSKAFSRKHLAIAVTMGEKREMVRLHNAGISYSQLEDIFHLVDNNGMNSWRCVKEIEAIRKARAGKSPEVVAVPEPEQRMGFAAAAAREAVEPMSQCFGQAGLSEAVGILTIG